MSPGPPATPPPPAPAPAMTAAAAASPEEAGLLGGGVRASVVGTSNTRDGTLYRISVQPAGGGAAFSVLRSLTEFKTLHAQCARERAQHGPNTPHLPSLPVWSVSSLIRSSSPLSRMEALNTYLITLLTSEVIATLPAIIRFLQPAAPELRRHAWPLLLSMHAPLLPGAPAYAALLQTARERLAAVPAQAAEREWVRLIDTDLSRTFASLALFSEGEPMHAMLREVLWTYCSMADGLPYRQGMSHLAAVLLLHVHEPPLACACLSALLSGYPILRACGACSPAPPTLPSHPSPWAMTRHHRATECAGGRGAPVSTPENPPLVRPPERG